MGAGLVGLLFLVAIAIGLVALVRKTMDKEGQISEGADLIAYLLLALAVGTAAFSLAELGEAAFPGDAFISDVDFQVASALAGLVVATPIAWVLWRRQTRRRQEHPGSAGWTVYLSVIQAVFMTAFAITAFLVLDYLVGDGDSPSLVNAIVFAAVLVFHEVAVRRSPPGTDGADLPRVIGSAIGLIMTSIGVGGLLYWLLDLLYGSLTPTSSNAEATTWLAFLIVGAPIWYYEWLRRWDTEPGTPRNAWMVIASVFGVSTAIGAAGTTAVQLLLFMFTETDPAATHFTSLPGTAAVGVVGLLVWWHHRTSLGEERTNAVRSYGYAMAAIGLGISIGGATGLATVAFSPADFINDPTEAVIAVIVILVTGLSVWGWYWTRAQAAPRETEAGATPRRFYLVGLAVITGLVSAGALIGTLVVLFQLLIAGESNDTMALQASLFVFSGLATWHLLRANGKDRELIVSPDVVTPFDLTIVCSHPGPIATLVPKEARVKILYRGDDVGLITETMASAIVEEVGQRSSIVWVDDRGYRIAAAR